MSARPLRLSELVCDARDCTTRFEAYGSVTDVRRQAVSQGWIYGIRKRLDSGPSPTFDFCPDHRGALDHYGVIEVVLRSNSEVPR